MDLQQEPGESPVVTVNGKPFFPVILSTFYRMNQTGYENIKSAVNVRDFIAGADANPFWVAPDTYDFSQVDARINELLRETPDAYIAPYIWCMPPLWYTDRYPERISAFNDGSRFQYYTSTVTFSSPEFRADARAAMTALIRHCEEHFGSKIFMYNLIGGVSCEWQGWGAHHLADWKKLADYSPHALRDFKAFAKEYQVETTAIPSYQERTHSADGLFRDPRTDARSMLYDVYGSHSIASCINELAAAAKEACHRSN